jgi:hypothetical protein
VDQCDFGYLQNCFSSTGIGPGCTWADLNGDGLINNADFTLFQSCMTGPDTPVDPACAE